MISPFRILEILICSLVTFGPLVAVTIYPCRKNLRFSAGVTAIFAAVAIITQCLGNVLVGTGLVETAAFVKLPLLVLHFVLAMVVIEASVGKKLFVLFSALCLSLMVRTGAGMLEALLFAGQAEGIFTWTDLITSALMEALLLVPYFILLNARLTYAMVKPNQAFGWLWILPLVAVIVGLVLPLPALVNLLIMTVIFCAAMAVTSSVAGRKRHGAHHSAPRAPRVEEEEPDIPVQETPIREAPRAPVRETVRETPQEAPAKPHVEIKSAPASRRAAAQAQAPKVIREDPTHQLQVMQRNNLMERIAEADQFHRELCRHIEAMAYRLDRRQYDKLAKHVHALQAQLSEEIQTVYCHNQELNNLIIYFIRMAGYCGARVYTNMHVSQIPDIPTRDLTVMLGNLLDYALDSCKRLNSYDRRIYASLRNNGKAMYLNVEFTCDSAVQAVGAGMTVCADLVDRYNGHLETSCINGIYKITAILHPSGNQAPSTAQIHNLQYVNLMERVSESDQFHRELLRHVEAMAYRLERKQYDKLHVHVSALLEQLQTEERTNHCDNREINSVIAYFNRMAGYCGTRIYTNMHVSTEPIIPTKNLTIMLGNLMDNALTACKNQGESDRRIYASLRNNGKCMYLNVEYTCDANPQEDNLSIGICRQIANCYNGHLETSNINGVFKTTAILRP